MKLAIARAAGTRDAVRRFLADRAPLSRVRELMETPDGMDRVSGSRPGRSSACRGSPSPRSTAAPGSRFAEQAIVLEELGAALYGGPYLASAVIAATALLSASDEAARRELLPGIASGQAVATLAFTEDDGSWDPAAVRLTASPAAAGWLGPGRAQELRAGRAHRRPDPGGGRHRLRAVAVRVHADAAGD